MNLYTDIVFYCFPAYFVFVAKHDTINMVLLNTVQYFIQIKLRIIVL